MKKKTYYVCKSDHGVEAFKTADKAHRSVDLCSIHYVKKVEAYDKKQACIIGGSRDG